MEQHSPAQRFCTPHRISALYTGKLHRPEPPRSRRACFLFDCHSARFPSVSICFFRDEWRPDSFYDKIKTNMQNQFHTLCLLGQKENEHDQREQRRSQRRSVGACASAKLNGSIGRLVGGPPCSPPCFCPHVALHLVRPASCPPADIKVKEQSFENMAK